MFRRHLISDKELSHIDVLVTSERWPSTELLGDFTEDLKEVLQTPGVSLRYGLPGNVVQGEPEHVVLQCVDQELTHVGFLPSVFGLPPPYT